MRISIWFETVNTDHEPVIFVETDDPLPIAMPSIGEQVGIWQDDRTKNNYPLFYVVMVRHYFFKNGDGSWSQEIHVMCEQK